MKTFKKMMALMIAMVMVLATATVAFATNGTSAQTQLTGSITVKSNDTVSVNGRSFTAYKLLDAVFSADGLNVAYTIPGEEDGTLANFYNGYFTTSDDTNPENPVITTGKAAAAAARQKFDQYVAERIEEMDNAADLQAFIKAALNAVANANDVTKIGPFVGEDDAAKFENLAPGFYLVADSTSPEPTPVSALMLDTVNDADVEIVIKANQPTPDKEVVTATATDNDGTTTYTVDTNGANNVGIGDTVNYKLTEKVPNWKGYDHFYFIINDTMSTGLTFNNDIKVTGWKKDAISTVNDPADEMYVVDRDGTFYKKTVEGVVSYTTDADENGVTDKATKYSRYVKKVLVSGEDYYVYLASENKTDLVDPDDSSKGYHTFEIAFKNIKDFAVDSDIIVTYSANVNADAITTDANGNSATATYSNDPSKSEKGDNQDQPGKPADTTNHPVDVTPASTTQTYSTGLTITKYDATTLTKSVLPGVEFTLTGTKDVVTVTDQDYFTQNDSGSFYLLKNGKYTQDAPITEEHMELRANIGDYAAVDASGYVIDSNATGDDVKVFGETTYRPFNRSLDVNENIEFNKALYVLVNTNTDAYTDINIKYARATAQSIGKQPVAVKMIGTTDAHGKLEFKNLSEGTYTLSETGTPDGFNSIADITFVIKWNDPAGDPSVMWERKTVEGTSVNDTAINYNSETGCFTVEIDNKKGTELPETGGIGTTIFYIVGTILVIGAGIVLISRKRMAAR